MTLWSFEHEDTESVYSVTRLLLLLLLHNAVLCCRHCSNYLSTSSVEVIEVHLNMYLSSVYCV
jgi:hypothetical protein